MSFSHSEGTGKKQLHTLRLLQPHNIKDSGCDIAKRPILFIFLLVLILDETQNLRVASHDEWDLVSRVCGMRITGLGVLHLLGVTVVGSDEEDVAGLLAGFVDNTDGLVSVSDGDYGGVVDTCVTNLGEKAINKDGTMYCKWTLTISGGAKLHIMNSCSLFSTSSATFSATPLTLISGCLSYVGT
jgi:hypothetical protein